MRSMGDFLWAFMVVVVGVSVGSSEEIVSGDDPLGADGVPGDDPLGMVVVPSPLSFDDTYAAVVEAVEANELVGVISEIDHKAAAATRGVTLLPLKVVVFGDPSIGVPVMKENLLVGIDLPMKIVVTEDDSGDVYMGYNDPQYLVARFGSSLEDADTLALMDSVPRSIVASVAGIPEGDVPDLSSGVDLPRVGLVTKRSLYDYETTWSNLMDAIDSDEGTYKPFEVDYETWDPSLKARLVSCGDPAIGGPLMAKSATTGYDLPFKFLVWEDEEYGIVWVVTNEIAFKRDRHGLGDTDLVTTEFYIYNYLMGRAAGY